MSTLTELLAAQRDHVAATQVYLSLPAHATPAQTKAATSALTLAYLRFTDAREANEAALLAEQLAYVPKANRWKAAAWAKRAALPGISA